MEAILAIVQRIVPGKHGAFVITTSDCKEIQGSITFSLKPRVWKEKNQPAPGTVVVLENLTKKYAGWRANKARFFRPNYEAISRIELKPNTRCEDERGEME